jgi:hypothetical protein
MPLETIIEFTKKASQNHLRGFFDEVLLRFYYLGRPPVGAAAGVAC